MADKINLDKMHERHYGLTQSIAGAYEEAASVCLSRHHTSPSSVTLSDNRLNSVAEVSWTAPSHQVLAAWGNEIDTTEQGAYGCVIAGVELLRNLLAVRRAETKTGCDYYVGPKGSGKDDLEGVFRLEVSGLSDGKPRDVERRLLQKMQQLRDGASNIPALAGVVGFHAMLLMLQDVTEQE